MKNFNDFLAIINKENGVMQKVMAEIVADPDNVTAHELYELFLNILKIYHLWANSKDGTVYDAELLLS